MEKVKKFVRDFILGAAGLLAMNGVLSLLVYPFLERSEGAAGQGKILFFMAIAGLMGATFGSGASYGRLKHAAEERETENGEYNRFLLGTALLLLPVTTLSILLKGERAGATFFGIFAVFLTMTVRHYADVEYRLSLNYKQFSLYYCVIAAGYLLGLLLYKLTGRWVLIFLTGEVCGLLFVAITGKIFRKPYWGKTPEMKAHLASVAVLSLSFFLSDFVLAADRLLFPLLLPDGDELTAIYYYACLVGKMMSLISSPLNGVLSGYMAKEEGTMKRSSFLKLIGLLLGVWVVVTACTAVGSGIFVKLFYPAHYQEARPLFIIANAGQVLFFICNTMMVVVLRYTDVKNQIIVSGVYILAFFALTVPLILKLGVTGMAWGLLAVNVLKFLSFSALGFRSLVKSEKKAE